jgi:hypothetical protein
MPPGTGKGPKPYKQRTASTIFLRVPVADWPALIRGKKREFRAASGNASGLHFVQTPTPVVCYMERLGKYAARLMVLERRWSEPLGAITPESLRAEGFQSFAEFRRYWMRREHRRFRPTREITVYEVRPWEPTDYNEFAYQLLHHLYGEFLPDEA